jgi:hypothetical protein
METSDELKKWVDALTVSEKRFVKLLGKARAGSSSQLLDLFDLLNKADADTSAARKLLRQNLPTVSIRLKDLMLDALRILHKENTTDALLRTTLDEIAILHEKKLHRAVARQLKRTRRLALETCRYGCAHQCIEWDLKIVATGPPAESREALKKLRIEETDVLKKLEEQRSLRNRNDILLTIVKQFSLHRDPQVLIEVRTQSEHEMVQRLSESGGYVERTYAVNILGIRDLYERKPMLAIKRYKKLLKEWQTHPDWQRDQTELLLQVCRYYQFACFYSPVDWDEARSYMAMLSGFKGLSPDARCDFERMLYHNQFTLALNSGKLDSVKTLIPEIEAWMKRATNRLSESQILPFLNNFAVAEFLCGNYVDANKIVIRILNTPNRNVRTDIREFALVLQMVLQYELDHDNLSEYLTRAGQRRFSKTSSEINFEIVVIKHLALLVRKGSQRDTRKSLDQLIRELDQLAEQLKDSIPLLGLNEIRMWAQSKKTGIPLRDIFLDAVKKNLEALEQTEAL